MRGQALFLLCAIALTSAKPRDIHSDATSACAQENSEGALFAHENCNRFYKCNGEKPVAHWCPAGLMYNINAEYCDWSYNVECGDRTIAEEKGNENNGNDNQGSTGPQVNGHSDPSEAPAICAAENSDGVLIAHENCNQFYKCSEGLPVALDCPDNLLYNPAAEYCDWPQNVECGDRRIPEQVKDNSSVKDTEDLSSTDSACAQENSEGKLVAHENCNRFYKCNGEKLVALWCPNGLMYNINAEYCDWSYNVECGERTIAEQEVNGGSENGNEENSGPALNGHGDPSEAPAICAADSSDGVLVAHENCNQFYKCSRGNPVTLYCPDTLLYHPEVEVCDWPQNVDCGTRNH